MQKLDESSQKLLWKKHLQVLKIKMIEILLLEHFVSIAEKYEKIVDFDKSY